MAASAEKFEAAIRDAITVTLRETSYRPSLFMQMVDKDGAHDACLRLIRAPKPSDGFTKLWELGRLDLTVEAYALKPEFAELFTEEDLATARKRLRDYGYKVS